MCFGATREPVEPLKKLEPSSKKTFCRYGYAKPYRKLIKFYFNDFVYLKF
jgi:hypothetical protein